MKLPVYPFSDVSLTSFQCELHIWLKFLPRSWKRDLAFTSYVANTLSPKIHR